MIVPMSSTYVSIVAILFVVTLILPAPNCTCRTATFHGSAREISLDEVCRRSPYGDGVMFPLWLRIIHPGWWYIGVEMFVFIGAF